MPDTIALKTQQTLAWIALEGVSITISRKGAWVDDGAGGRVQQPMLVTVPPQKALVLGKEHTDTIHREKETTDGVGRRVATYVTVIGGVDLNIATEDTFMWGGREYTVYTVYPDRSFETKAEAVNYSGG